MGDGTAFTLIYPDFEEYFEELRRMAGEEGPGRRLPPFHKKWVEVFMAGHERRKKRWREENQRARAKVAGVKMGRARM
jgi:hypothetical protein